MRSRSCSSTDPDPYRAGLEIGEALRDLDPELVFLFSTIHYEGSPEIAEAIYDVLPNEDLILLGCTGDGYYAGDQASGMGVGALAIRSGPELRWHLGISGDVGAKPYEATSSCLAQIHEACQETPAYYVLLSDFRTDSSEIVRALQDHARAPVVGGAAGDDGAIERCFLYAGQEVRTDSILLLAAEGPSPFAVRITHGVSSVGEAGVVTETDGTCIYRISGVPAMKFIEQSLGKPIEAMDQGVVAFRVSNASDPDDFVIRSILLDPSGSDGHVQLFGGVSMGDHVQICLAPPARIAERASEIGSQLEDVDFEPSALLLFSCAGNRRILGPDADAAVFRQLGTRLGVEAFAGFPSYGEFAALPGGDEPGRPLYHNMTMVSLVIGAKA